MNLKIFEKAKSEFTNALCSSGMDEHSFELSFSDELINDEDYYSFLMSVQVNKFSTDAGDCVPEPVTFQIDYDKDTGEIVFIIGEDTGTEITYGNVFAYMYFSTCKLSEDL